MKIEMDWKKSLPLPRLDEDGIKDFLEDVEAVPGLYIFARVHGGKTHPLYVGQAKNLRSRLKGQFNNRKLMKYVQDAKSGTRVIVLGHLGLDGRKDYSKALNFAETAFIREFIAEGTSYTM